MTTTELIAGGDDSVLQILAAGAANADPYTDNMDSDDDTVIHVVPEGYEVIVTDLIAQRQQHARTPARKTGAYNVGDAASFLKYFDKHATDSAEIWVGDRSIKAVLNAADDHPSYEDHTLTMVLHHSPEWNAWTSLSGRLLGQQEFAEFLEANAVDIVQPTMGEILEVAQSLEATTKVDFKSAFRTTDGQRAFRYEETTTAKAGQKGELEIPERLGLALRVYTASAPSEVTARFRYRINGDRLTVGIVIDQQDRIRGTAIGDLAGAIVTAVDGRALVMQLP